MVRLTSTPGVVGSYREATAVAERVVELATIPVVVVKSKESGTPNKKDIKRAEKRQKKEKKKLKSMLGLEPQAQPEEEADG